MDIICNHQKIISAIRNAERLVGKNISLPILGSLLLQTHKGHLQISATNLEAGIHMLVPAKIEKDGHIAVPARVFSECMGNINDEKINLKTDKDSLFVTSENFKTQILGMKADDFPIIPTLKAGKETKIHSEIMRDAFVSVIEAAAISETRPELAGIHMASNQGGFEVAATDSFRLSEYRGAVLSSSEPSSVIIPRFSAGEVVRLLDRANEAVEVVASDSQWMLRGGDFEFISRLVDGHYPDYKKIIPERPQATAVMTKGDLERAIRITGVFSSSISDVKIKASGDIVHLSARNSDRGEASASVKAKISGAFELSMNFRYLLDGTRVLHGEEILLGFCGDGAPLIMKIPGNETQTYVVMPLRS